MTAGKASSPPILLGSVAVCCAVLGLFVWLGYSAFAMRASRAAFSQDSGAPHRAAMYADSFRFTQLLLAISAMALGWASLSRGSNSRKAMGLGYAALLAGVAVLMLSFLIV